MPHQLSRREFLERATLAAASFTAISLDASSLGAESATAPVSGAPSFDAVSSAGEAGVTARTADAASPMVFGNTARPFDLHAVRLLPGLQQHALDVNRTFMLGLSTDRLLHVFRVNAGLPSNAMPYGGWEAPDNELRGHFVGHYLSACALMFAQTGDAAIKARGADMVAGLAPVQVALGDGYLSAFPKELFERLKLRQRVWAPFYTYHKILQGLLDSYTLSGNAQALIMARGMADWTKAYAAPIPEATWQSMLTTEYGGMNDTLRELAQVTGDASYAELARKFDHEKLLGALAVGRDELKGVHANTNIPKVLGAARWYEMTGEERPRAIVDFFWEDITQRRAYATGGTSNDEEWQGEPGQLAKALGGFTQETCVTYNMLKLTRHKFMWSPEARVADYYERAWYNGILPTQHPADGEKAYYTPLADGYWKLFGTPEKGFWCCHGSGVENFSKVADSVYFHDDTGIWVNLFVPSEVHWDTHQLRLRQTTRFPESDTTTLTVTVPKPTRAALRVRVPYWATRPGIARLNGRALDAFAGPGSYLVVDRVWNSGDTLQVTLPMSLHTHPMPDDRTMQAVLYGPLVLVAKMGTDGITSENRRAVPTPPREVPVFVNANPHSAPPIVASSDDPSTWLKPVAGKPLEFRTIGQATNLTFVPLHTLFDERYATYLRVTRA